MVHASICIDLTRIDLDFSRPRIASAKNFDPVATAPCSGGTRRLFVG